MASASAVVGSTVCFTSTLTFSCFATDVISFASFELTFFELNLGTVSLTSRLGLDGAIVEGCRKRGSDRVLAPVLVLRPHPPPRRHPSLPFPLVLTMPQEESITLEETNKLRISLGLKPLTDDKAPADSAEQRAEDNYAKQREKEAQDKEKKYVHPPPNLTNPLTRGFPHLSGGSRTK